MADQHDLLHAEDLIAGGKLHKPTLEIAEVFPPGSVLNRSQNKAFELWAVKFKGRNKTLVLCVTNQRVIQIVTGEAPGEKWIGKKITIAARSIDSFGSRDIAIRVLPPVGTPIRQSILKHLGRDLEYAPQTATKEATK